MGSTTINIKKGSRWLCIKDVVSVSGRIYYYKGKIYKSDFEGCITDEELDILHSWNKKTPQYFIRFGKNKRSGRRI